MPTHIWHTIISDKVVDRPENSPGSGERLQADYGDDGLYRVRRTAEERKCYEHRCRREILILHMGKLLRSAP